MDSFSKLTRDQESLSLPSQCSDLCLSLSPKDVIKQCLLSTGLAKSLVPKCRKRCPTASTSRSTAESDTESVAKLHTSGAIARTIPCTIQYIICTFARLAHTDTMCTDVHCI